MELQIYDRMSYNVLTAHRISAIMAVIVVGVELKEFPRWTILTSMYRQLISNKNEKCREGEE